MTTAPGVAIVRVAQCPPEVFAQTSTALCVCLGGRPCRPGGVRRGYKGACRGKGHKGEQEELVGGQGKWEKKDA